MMNRSFYKAMSHKYRFSTTLPTSTNYPYIFNGLNMGIPKQNNITQTYIQEIFGNDTFDGFKQAYKYVLYSLANNEKKGLQSILQNNLTKAMDINKKVKLINQNSQIQIICGRSITGFGVGFQREGQIIDIKKMSNDNENIFCLNTGIMMNPSPVIALKLTKSGIPMLLSYQIFFLSEMRLIQQQSSSSSKPKKQLHSVQFQVEGLKIEDMKRIFLQMIGKDFQWRVGDIDRVLKGNIKLE